MDRPYDRESERLALMSRRFRLPIDEHQRMLDDYRVRSEKAFAPSTLRNYRQIIANFSAWCSVRGYAALPPVPARIVAEYIEDMGGKLRVTTIETRLWAISEWHRAHFLPTPCRDRIVELALKGVKRTYGAWVRQAAPLSKREVLRTIQGMGSSRIELRDKAVLWIASDSWCRASEIVSFKVRDLIRQDDGSSLLFVSRSKTDPYGEGAYAYLSPRGTLDVLRWVQLAELKGSDPILTKSQVGGKKTHLDPATLSRILRRCTGRRDISAHSTRVGGVHDAFRLGCDLSAIMIAGRWTSPEMPARYGRQILASQSAAAQVASAHGCNEPGVSD